VRVFRGLPPSAGAPVALTIGTFDGIHRGHQAMLSRLVEAADESRAAPAVLTFDPYPREFFAARRRRRGCRRCGQDRALRRPRVEHVYIARFKCGAGRDDAGRVRRRGPGAPPGRTLGAGRRGLPLRQGRAGDLATLRAAASSFSVETMRTVNVEGKRASSTAIRARWPRRHRARQRAARPAVRDRRSRRARAESWGAASAFDANIAIRYKPPFTGVFACASTASAPPAGPASPASASAPRCARAASAAGSVRVRFRRIDLRPPRQRRVPAQAARRARYPDLDALTRQIRADVAQARDYFAAAR